MKGILTVVLFVLLACQSLAAAAELLKPGLQVKLACQGCGDKKH